MVELNKTSIQRLIDLILWNIGRDIECDGNLLLLFGFRRYRPPRPNMGSSRYHIFFEGYEVVLWGFGMLVRDGLSIFVSRHRYAPKILALDNAQDTDQSDYRTDGSCCDCDDAAATSTTSITDIWSLSDLSVLREPTYNEYEIIKKSLSVLFKLLYKYELWIQVIKGREYRVRCIKAFGTTCSVDDIIVMLRSLIDVVPIPPIYKSHPSSTNISHS
ncbi:hypothetical protein HRbin04_01264 [archaeon HR04]|uniref:Hypothetical conserved protein n=2 Tax=Thermoproteati TaxID=1783275 RepID=Q4LEH6_9ARCH|nr:hypothetical conserved protein [uncultured Candidatus Nitrosocaldus sp.]BAL60313.1 hypothetical conserved protein [uncultured crenarchaeote]GBC73857.1 hypothetical protein HRbin04_01264 [archaeon HR04]